MSKKYLGFICILYSILFFYIFIRGYMGNYLAPQMHKNILIAGIILFVIGIVIIFSKKFEYKFKFSDLVLLLPVLLFIFAKDGRLSTSLASNRSSSFDSRKGVVEKKEKVNNSVDNNINTDNDTGTDSSNNPSHILPEIPEEVRTNNLPKSDSTTKVDYDVVDEVYSTIADMVTFSKHPEKIVGKTIRVRGFTMLENDMFSKDYFALGRYIISCCVADSSFGGFVVKYDDMSFIKDNAWYEIEGTLEVAKSLYGTDMVYINVNKIKELDSKKEQIYVYPCYTYGDGSCSALDNYDIEIEY